MIWVTASTATIVSPTSAVAASAIVSSAPAISSGTSIISPSPSAAATQDTNTIPRRPRTTRSTSRREIVPESARSHQ